MVQLLDSSWQAPNWIYNDFEQYNGSAGGGYVTLSDVSTLFNNMIPGAWDNNHTPIWGKMAEVGGAIQTAGNSFAGPWVLTDHTQIWVWEH
jgi:hypothetical protein